MSFLRISKGINWASGMFGDPDGATVAQYDYDPYGQRTKLSGTADADFGYAGSYHHAPSGLNLTLYRAYDPALGRWLSRDPIGEHGGVNSYGYVGNEPLGRVDPLGLTYGSNWNFFASWVLGAGQNQRSYGPGSLESEEMRNSIPGRELRRKFYREGCQNFQNGEYGTGEAYLDTIVNPWTRDWSDTSAQVGGFYGATATNNGDGTVTLIIRNTAGANSFFLHAVPNAPDQINIPSLGQLTVPLETSTRHLPGPSP